MSANPWSPERYQSGHSYVWELGAPLVDLLAPQPGERILDVGCGTGQLTAKIAAAGAQVVGMDSSSEMFEQAGQNYPDLTFVLEDATTFRFASPFDAVFSNAALHWVKNAEAAAESISLALRSGGRFVAELGGKGCIASVVEAVRAEIGGKADDRFPWLFPSIGDYAPVLERQGLEVRQAMLFDRPTPVEGDKGMEDWLRMFGGPFFHDFTPEETTRAVTGIAGRLRDSLYRDGVWTLDYRRLRLVAVKI